MNEMPLLLLLFLIRIKQNYKLASVLKDVAYCCIDFFIDRHIWACVSVTRDILVERKTGLSQGRVAGNQWNIGPLAWEFGEISGRWLGIN